MRSKSLVLFGAVASFVASSCGSSLDEKAAGGSAGATAGAGGAGGTAGAAGSGGAAGTAGAGCQASIADYCASNTCRTLAQVQAAPPMCGGFQVEAEGSCGGYQVDAEIAVDFGTYYYYDSTTGNLIAVLRTMTASSDGQPGQFGQCLAGPATGLDMNFFSCQPFTQRCSGTDGGALDGS